MLLHLYNYLFSLLHGPHGLSHFSTSHSPSNLNTVTTAAMSTNKLGPSPRAEGMNHLEVYNEHKKVLAKIASNDHASPTHVKDFMEQQGYMYFNARTLLRFVRMRLRE